MKRLILIALIFPGISIAQTAADPCEQLGQPIKEEIRQLIYSGSLAPQVAKAHKLGARYTNVVLGCKIALLNVVVVAIQAAAVAKALTLEVKK